MLVGNDYSQHVFTRLFDFFTVNSQWQRRLWNVGLVLALRELDEAIEAQHLRALSGEAVRWLAESIKGRLKDDPGVGTEAERKALTRLLEGDLSFEGVPHRVLRQYTADIESMYLDRWEKTLRNGTTKPSRERAARALGAHLLDGGFSQQALREWLDDLADDARSLELADVVLEAKALSKRPKQDFQVLLLYERTPPGTSPRPEGWTKMRQVRQWLDANGIGAGYAPNRAHGGIVIKITSPDVYSAVGEAASIADRFAARVAVGTRSEMLALRETFVAGTPRPLPLRRSRRVGVHSLDRHKTLYDRSGDPAIDSALELVSHLDYGQGPVAVAGGWSAVEYLLSGPGDAKNVLAADRLAALVACSWPRAELTTIARNRIQKIDDALSAKLAGLATNKDRCDRLLLEMRTEGSLDLAFQSDRAALHRIDRLVGDPASVLNDVRGHAQESLRRLYRQRNLVLHGGRTRGVGLEATLRTVAPLVGAGVDRVVHAYLTAKVDPLQTAARAEFELQRAGRPGAPEVTALLE
jgi:hypothetical protein